MERSDVEVVGQKAALRRQLIAARRTRSDADRVASAHANEVLLTGVLAESAVVCAYLPLPSEPLTTGLLDRLVADGTTVLVPVVTADSPLDWCRYPGPTMAGAFGIDEPIGPRLGPGAITSADFILLPALAVDRSGGRLGRGGGHYDRTLALLTAEQSGGTGPELVAVVFDGELLDILPVEPHDRPVGVAVAAANGIHHFRR